MDDLKSLAIVAVLALLGAAHVNVLLLNRQLDAMGAKSAQ
jgi:hypothetical protein